jgi:hypothetical protein
MDPITKRKYNLTYKAKRKGLSIDGHRHQIRLRFEDIPKLILVTEALILITSFGFSVIEDRQLKFNLK